MSEKVETVRISILKDFKYQIQINIQSSVHLRSMLHDSNTQFPEFIDQQKVAKKLNWTSSRPNEEK